MRNTTVELITIVLISSCSIAIWRTTTAGEAALERVVEPVPAQYGYYERIRLGMTPVDVENAVGLAPGKYGFEFQAYRGSKCDL